MAAFDPSEADPRTRDELVDGTVVAISPDEHDPRFDRVHLVVPARLQPGGAPAPWRLTGAPACEWMTRYFLLQAAQVLDQLHVHDVAVTLRGIATTLRTVHDSRRHDAARRARCDA